jgi:hypothetical protein
MAWHDYLLWLTHGGNSVLLLNAALILMLWMLAGRAWGLAVRWQLALGGAVSLVLASKIAFLGWGLGSARLDFTGISGHAMLATAVTPVLVAALTLRCSARVRAWALGASMGLAVAVGLSRLALGVHSVSEVLAGWAVGWVVARVSIAGLVQLRRPMLAPWPMAVALALLLVLTAPREGYSPETHGVVVNMALWASGRTAPFTRSMLFLP